MDLYRQRLRRKRPKVSKRRKKPREGSIEIDGEDEPSIDLGVKYVDAVSSDIVVIAIISYSYALGVFFVIH